jgi:VWFA-related protein
MVKCAAGFMRLLPVIAASLVLVWPERGLTQQTPPVFRGGVEVVQLDVSVLGKDRKPVRGLTRADFTVFESGVPQRIVAFDAIDVPDAVEPPAKWMKSVTPDVTTNNLEERRLFVLVLDDALIPFEPRMMKNAKDIAVGIIDKLGPYDLACIVFTADNRNAQDFTSDHAKLVKALDRFRPGLATYKFGTDGGGVNTDANFYQFVVSTLHNVADYLIEIPQRRKTLVYIGPGVPVDLENAGTPMLASGVGRGMSDKVMAERLGQEMSEIFRQAQRANVNISTVDPTGKELEAYIAVQLREGPFAGGVSHRMATLSMDFVQAAAASTGGHAVVNTTDFGPGIDQIFEENGSYYLLGFQPANTKTDGSFRRLEVKVNRADVDVRTRSGYFAPKSSSQSAAKSGKTPSPLVKAMSGLLPNAELPMHVTLAPFAVPGTRDATVAMVLGLTQSVAQQSRGKTTETIELQTSAFTPEGSARGSQRQSAQVVLRPGVSGDVPYEVVSRIDLKPGRYQLRLAAHHVGDNKSGSVYAEVEVPDFSGAAISLSGVALSMNPPLPVAPKDGLSGLLPLPPTAEREFMVTQKVSAFLRAYQPASRAVISAVLSTRILDVHDRIVVNETQSLGLERFVGVTRPADPQPAMTGRMGMGQRQAGAPDPFRDTGPRTADITYPLPLDRLDRGPHVITFEITAGKVVARRDIRFVVR